MKKIKLFIEHQYDFELLGIVAPIKEYKMAWVVNNSLNSKLVKSDDFELELLNQPPLVISNFVEEKENGFVQLLKNKSNSDEGSSLYLIPELRMMDYFLLLQDQTHEIDLNDYIEKLSGNSIVQNVVKLNISKLKSKDNLLTY
jgi:hypothetical protein